MQDPNALVSSQYPVQTAVLAYRFFYVWFDDSVSSEEWQNMSNWLSGKDLV
jgi:hypothetical protein